MVSLMLLSSVMALLRYRNINRGHVTILLTSMLAAFTIAKDFTIHSSALLFYNLHNKYCFAIFKLHLILSLCHIAVWWITPW